MANSLISPLPLGFLTCLLPLVTYHTTYVVSLVSGYFEPCNPYWIDCVSISKTGRHGASYFIFKGGMIPTAILLVLYWQLNQSWLHSLNGKKDKLLLYLGLIGSISLIIYSLALGHSGDSFRLLRRFGVVFFIFCTFICQVKVGKELQIVEPLAQSGRHLLIFSATILSVAVVSLILDVSLNNDYDRLENTFEWWLFLLLIMHLFCIVKLWQKSHFCLDLKTKDQPYK